MKDPIVEEVRRHRMEHTQKFGGDLHAICQDLCACQATFGKQVVRLTPRKIEKPKPAGTKKRKSIRATDQASDSKPARGRA
jgi:hypothetical protein